ncbi:insulinase family protein [Zhongshania aliphaticivorans]|uniref:insulinase family protein n=1 Tax=Zhongshania aliphaticivorans TaxID=1470434 RepID=UPI0039C92C8F
MNYLKSTFVFLFVLQLSACAWLEGVGLNNAKFGIAGESAAVAKPPGDQRAYRYTVLENGLKVLLISDAGADKAAASLDVNVGSRQDPENYQGLAHFLEHMLFLGTEKYPEAGSYQAFITAHGGSHNAFTSFEDTNYFFDISADSLEPALDQFAQFFVAPLFNAEYVGREVNAVNSEYRARIKDDRRRELAVFKAQVNPAHPFAKFSVGNLQTLHSDNETALREQLLAFYQRNYSANIMALTVIGRESLDELEAMVRPKFSGVANRERQLDAIIEPLFKAGDLPRWINIQPVQNRRSLSVNFPVPDAEPHWRSKPLNYIGNILGHEGEGSLLAVLKSKGWADGLSAGESLNYQGGAMFGIEVALTEVGLKHADEIVALIYQNIAQLRGQGVERWRFAEQAGLAIQGFLFRAQPAPINDVVQLSMAMHKYPAAEVMRAPYLMDDYQPELLAEFLAAMRPDNSFITLVAPGVKPTIDIPRYQVGYSKRPVTQGELAAWASGSSKALTLPAKNNFVASDFSLKSGRGESKPVPVPSAAPLELWLNTDDIFELPKAKLYLQLATDKASSDAESLAKTEMWLRMVKDQLNELTYPAQLAGLDFDLDVDWRGIEISIGGFNQKQGELLAQILAALKSPAWQENRFARLQAQRLRQFENAVKQSPYQQLIAELPRMLNHENPGLAAHEAATRKLTMAGVAAHAKAVLESVQLRMLLDGNFDQADAQKIAKLVTKALPVNASSAKPIQHISHLTETSTLREIAAEHDDSAALLYLQSAETGKQARVVMGLTAQMLSADFYHQLRTRKQLGYVVSASVYPQREVGGLIFLVQSSVVDAATLQTEINQYVKDWLAAGIDEATFRQHKASLLKRLAEQPENLWEAAGRHWQDLLENYPEFDSREQLVQALNALSYDDWLAAARRDLSATSQRGLLLYAAGKWPNRLPEGKRVESAEKFKAKLPAYSFK